MPTWHELPDKERLAVVAFIKTFSSRFKDEHVEPAMIKEPLRATAELVARGKDLYRAARCFQCHGEDGKGDGEAAADLTDDLKFPTRPSDFTRGQFKSGSTVRDIFRTMTLGLDDSPMPSFADSMSEEERWAISYYVLSLSAWKDPLTGETLDLPAAVRAALDSPDIVADHPRFALDPARPDPVATERAKSRTLYPGIRE